MSTWEFRLYVPSVFLFSSLILVILDFSWVVFQHTYNSGNEVQMMFDDHHDAFETFCTLNINGSSGNVPSLVSGMTGNLSNLAPMLLPCVHLKAPDMFADQDKNTDALLKTLNISRVIMGCRYIEKRRAQQLHWRQTADSVSRMSSEAWTWWTRAALIETESSPLSGWTATSLTGDT